MGRPRVWCPGGDEICNAPDGARAFGLIPGGVGKFRMGFSPPMTSGGLKPTLRLAFGLILDKVRCAELAACLGDMVSVFIR